MSGAGNSAPAAAADVGALGSDFVPVVAENRVGSNAAMIEIEIGGAIVRVGTSVDLVLLAEVMRRLKAAR
jgi:hypothetical protein